jgi:folate-binding protein YgfZ
MSATSAASTALRLSGRDVLAVLHRVTTQKLLDLPPGDSRTTLFCDHRGRLLHRAVVVHAPDASVWLLREDAPGAPLAADLDKAVFREDVTIEDRSDALPVRLVEGASGVRRRFADGGVPTYVPESDAFALVVGDGAGSSGIDETARIRAGRARSGFEVSAEFNPYEVNLALHVHLDKGCYTGQESLQRLFTYDGVRRRLVRFSGGGAPPAPQDLHAGGAVAGRLTSAAAGAGAWLALAVVRTDALEAEQAFTLEDGTPLAAPHVFERARARGR